MSDLILLVEDNEKNMKLARDLLQFHGFATIEATNAEDGITLARDRTPKLVLGFDGFITKPIDVRAFPQQVRDAVARGRV